MTTWEGEAPAEPTHVRPRTPTTREGRLSKPEIAYPCRWGYRVIGTSAEAIRAAIDEVVGDSEHHVELARSSARGRFVSFHLEVLVRDEAHRVGIYQALSGFACVRVVL